MNFFGRMREDNGSDSFNRFGAPHTTSSILLPTGSIRTAYGTHYRAVAEGWEPFYGPRDTGLVKWNIDQ